MDRLGVLIGVWHSAEKGALPTPLPTVGSDSLLPQVERPARWDNPACLNIKPRTNPFLRLSDNGGLLWEHLPP